MCELGLRQARLLVYANRVYWQGPETVAGRRFGDGRPGGCWDPGSNVCPVSAARGERPGTDVLGGLSRGCRDVDQAGGVVDHSDEVSPSTFQAALQLFANLTWELAVSKSIFKEIRNLLAIPAKHRSGSAEFFNGSVG